MKRKKPAHAKVVVAEEFRLVGKDGTIRAVLELDGEGDPHLCLLDKKGKLRASLALHDGESFLELLDKNEKVRASIGLGKTGLLPVWLTPAYANPAFISNSMGLR